MSQCDSDFRYELLRSKHPEEIKEVTDILAAKAVPHTVAGNHAVFDYAEIGRSDLPTGDLMIMVQPAHVDAARAAIEEATADIELPEDHFLHTATDEELADILASPMDWNAQVVAHARQMAQARGVTELDVAQKSNQNLATLTEGQPAPLWLVILGWLGSPIIGNFSGIIGIVISVTGFLIGFSLALQRNKTLEGDFPTFDKASQRMGSYIIAFQAIALLALLIYRVMFSGKAHMH